jgi:hypothetical protein
MARQGRRIILSILCIPVNSLRVLCVSAVRERPYEVHWHETSPLLKIRMGRR